MLRLHELPEARRDAATFVDETLGELAAAKAACTPQQWRLRLEAAGGTRLLTAA